MILLTLLGSGCATLSEPECRNADWYMIGMEDGMKGLLPSRIGNHREACAKYNVVPDVNAYRNGHAQGTRQYCTESSGFAAGKEGKSYNNVCPPDLNADFMRGYSVGKLFHDVSSEITKADNAIYSYKDRIKKLEKEIRQKEVFLVDDATKRDDRQRILDAIKKQQHEIGELEEKILENERKKAVSENEYLNLQRRYNYNY